MNITRTDSEILEWIATWVEEIVSPEHDEDGEIIVIKFSDPAGFSQRNHGKGATHLEALRNAVIPCMGLDATCALCVEPVAN